SACSIYAALQFVEAGISWLWLRERPTLATMLASALAMAGIIVMLGPSADGPRLGDGLAMLATSATALMTVAIRRSRHVEMVPVAGLSTALSALVASPLAEHLFDLTARDFLVAAGFGVCAVDFGVIIFFIWS